jgi:hypothetical protein
MRDPEAVRELVQGAKTPQKPRGPLSIEQESSDERFIRLRVFDQRCGGGRRVIRKKIGIY